MNKIIEKLMGKKEDEAPKDGEQKIIVLQKQNPTLTNDERLELNREFYQVLRALTGHAAIFQRIVQAGMRPNFNYAVPTACITYDPKSGDSLNFNFNPSFWNALTEEGRKFFTCHEILHVLLQHGSRFYNTFHEKNNNDMQIANIAMDVAIHNMIEGSLGFKKEDVGIDWRNFCFFENTFEENKALKGLATNKMSAEKYFQLLKQNLPKVSCKMMSRVGKGKGDGKGQPGPKGKGKGDPKDGDGEGDGDPQDGKATGNGDLSNNHDYLGEVPKEMVEGIMEKLDEYDKNQLAEQFGKQAGHGEAVSEKIFEIKKRIFKRKWESIIKRWTMKSLISRKTKLVDSFATKPRRLPRQHLSNFMLPGQLEVPIMKERVQVFFYLDTSGSCVHLAERFFKAARSLDPRKFEINLYCFSDHVHKVDIKTGKLFGFGGTNFHAISQQFYGNEAKDLWICGHPLVFVITDGYGTNLDIPEENRKSWHWFLSEDYRSCIPQGCCIYPLSDYE